MSEQGIVIFEDGVTLSFGQYYCPDEPEYLITPTHTSSFLNEIVNSIAFKSSNHIYNDNLDLYHNALLFSLGGLITIFNNQKSLNSPTEVLSYVPLNPTEEQLTSLKENKILLNIEIQNVYGFQSYDFDDSVEYEGFEDYIKSNIKEKD